jgi:hypothetical protein
LHAGSYFYFPTAKKTYQSSGVYLYPIGLCVIGYGVPQLVNYYIEGRHSLTFYETTVYFILSHSIGLIHLISPSIIEKIYSFFKGKDAQFREELPEPIASTSDTKYVRY